MSDKYAALRQEISNSAIGSRDHLRKIALQLLDEIAEREAEREADKARIEELESRKVKLPPAIGRYSESFSVISVVNAIRAAGITLETGE